ncbi:MAG: IMP dehydrogenase [Bacteroidales bacterium]|nr:IMP dehydrogenase [Bacteroidales bacterium]
MKLDTSKFVGECLTYDDVLLVPAYSEVLPREVDTTTYFTRNIKLNIPLVSAAMDTVTESALAIAIAQEGGIGVLHKNMSIEAQAEEVRRVKRAENGMITDPITIDDAATVADALQMMKQFHVGGIPVVDKTKKLVGIVTNRDMRFERNYKRKIKEVMTKEVITATGRISFDKAAQILQEHRIEKLPVVDKNGKLVGLITYRDIMSLKSKPMACKDDQGRLRVAAGIGITANTFERAEALVEAGVDALVIDTAHGHTKGVIDAARQLRKKCKGVDLIVGNIATAEAAVALAEAGVDAVKVGIGPGSICTTRVVAGIGVPQLSAVYQVAQALKPYKIPLIADGGIRYSGDVVKAIAGGASSVMAGSLFAGTEEAPGTTIIFEGRKFKSYRGMGSVEAMQSGSKDRYFQDMEEDVKKLVPEGIVGRVPYKGLMSEVLLQLIGGLRAGMGYTGSKNIAALQKAKFIRITPAAVIEGHPHDITITQEAPNYSRR